METKDPKDSVGYLRSTKAIREQCGRLMARVTAGESAHFTLHPDKIAAVADYALAQMRADYPDLQIPYHSRWRHFGAERLALLTQKLAGMDVDAAAKVKLELVTMSVLLDAGAGPTWRYKDALTGKEVGRSEGLALASFDMFLEGGFSSDPDVPLTADLAGLRTLGKREFEAFFQVTPQNRLPALDGRLALIHKLAHVVTTKKEIFGDLEPRLGNIYDYLVTHAGNNKLPARKVLSTILEGLSPIWPGRVALHGVNLGDVWRHTALPEEDAGHGLVPFHKLSQWLAYSYVEPLEDAALEIGGLDELTGLAEYRNGGLFIDMGVLQLKDKAAADATHKADSELIVEWRALTIVLLDQIAELIRAKLDLTALELPLTKILQGGTWIGGRRIAQQLRPNGEPPLRLASDGTVF